MTLQRDVKRLQDAPRCGAKTRKGTPCRSPAVNGKRRCRMHGGAKAQAPAREPERAQARDVLRRHAGV